MAQRAQQRAAHIMQGMQQAAAVATASFRAGTAQPAARSGGYSYGRMAAKGVVMGSCSRDSLQPDLAAALAAAGRPPMIADAVVRVVARRGASGAMAKQPRVV
jgi:hypothetical protein